MRRPTLLSLLLLSLLTLASAAVDPARTPVLPTSPPPPLSGLGAPSGEAWETVQVPQGWSMVSFPLGAVDSLQGLTHAPMWYGAGAWRPLEALPVEPGLGYLVYGAAPGALRVSGRPQEGQLRATWLRAGWNLVGCPSQAPLPLSRVALAAPGGTLQVLEAAADPSPQPGGAWLYSAATSSFRGQAMALDLRDPSAALQPGQVTWIFAWRDLQLLWNADPHAPQVTSVSSPALAPGEALEIDGQGFGAPGTGLVTIHGLPVQPEEILDWQPTRVRLRVPTAATSGPLVLFAQGCPGNRVAFQVLARQVPSAGALAGLVQSSDGTPLAGAQVLTDDGHQAITDARGLFALQNLPAEGHEVFITRLGYRPGRGSVQIAAGATRRLQVVLSPVGEVEALPPGQGPGSAPASPEQSTTMHVTAYPYQLGPSRMWVKSIQVSEHGSYGRRWTKYWDTDQGDARFDLDCPGALVGRSYNVTITWRDRAGQERSDMWQPELGRPDGTFYYYHPD